MSTENDIRKIEERLATLDEERAKLVLQLNSLKNESLADAPTNKPLPPLLGRKSLEQTPLRPEEKVALFLKLFRCRSDVFPKRWENPKTGKQGYAPVCANEWVKPICQKPKIKCTACTFQKFLPLDEATANAHLLGKTIGTYAIREDDTCTFLAADFDKAAWSKDVLAYQKTARELGIDVAIERSRSGNGAHGWIFFE